MTRTPGEVSRIEAFAHQARAWFRDLAVMVHGLAQDRNLVTGKPAPVASNVRQRRIERHGDHIESRTHFIEKDVFGHPWQSVEKMAFVGVQWHEGEYDALMQHLNTLRLQTAMIIDFHEFNLFDRLMASDVSIRSLGRMKSPLKDLGHPEGHLLEQE